MSDAKRRRLESTIAAIRQRHGAQAIRRAADTPSPTIPHVSTGFAALDAITGCHGAPLGALTLLTGKTTSGKLTLAYKTLANAQRLGNTANNVGIIDACAATDPDYLVRCGVKLEQLLLVRPAADRDGVALLLDLVQSGALRMVLVDSLADLWLDRAAERLWMASWSKLRRLLRVTQCALVVVDEANPPWLRWLNLERGAALRQQAALHIELRRERWLRRDGEFAGYAARAQVLRSQWRLGNPSASIEFVFAQGDMTHLR